MMTQSTQVRQKQLSMLKIRVELIAWRIQEKGMSPQIRQALPESAMGVFERLLFETQAPDDYRLMLYENEVRKVEEDLSSADPSFWRTGAETIH